MNCKECQDTGWITVPAFPRNFEVYSIDEDYPLWMFPIQVKCPHCEEK